MTTIAWDGKVLAVDSRACGSTIIRTENAQKLWRLDSGDWLAVSGDYQDCMLALDWFRHGEPPEARPKLDDFVGIVLRAGKLYRYENKLICWVINEPFSAAGSGVEIAIGALAAGATAEEAVKIAARFDTDTNDRVQSSRYD